MGCKRPQLAPTVHRQPLPPAARVQQRTAATAERGAQPSLTRVPVSNQAPFVRSAGKSACNSCLNSNDKVPVCFPPFSTVHHQSQMFRLTQCWTLRQKVPIQFCSDTS